MAIEDTYNILSAGIKADNKKERKRQEKDEIKNFLTKGLIGIGNSVLKDKANTFLEGEQFYRENMQFKKGHSIANEFISTEKLARNDKLGYDAFWSNAASADRVDAMMTEKYGPKEHKSISDWNHLRATTIKDLGVDARKNHEEGLLRAQSFINQSGDEGEGFYAEYAKESRPTSIKDLIANKAKTMLGGKDLNIESRETTRKGYLNNAQALIAYDKAFDETGDNRVSEFFADKSTVIGPRKSIVKQELKDMGRKSLFGKDVGLELIATHKDSLGNETIVFVDEESGNKIGMSKEEFADHKELTDWVSLHSTTSEASRVQQAVGMSAVSKFATEEDADFFKGLAKEAGAKMGRSADKNRAAASRNAITHANIAGLKMLFRDGYSFSEEASERLAVVMYKKQVKNMLNQREGLTDVLGSNPFSHGKIFGTIVSMAEEQSTEERSRDYSNTNIERLTTDARGRVAMFEDYRSLSDKAMEQYDEIVSKTKNKWVAQAHEATKALVAISKKNPEVDDLALLNKLYMESLENPPEETQDTLETVQSNLSATASNAKPEPRALTLEDAQFFSENSPTFGNVAPEYILKSNPSQFRKFIELKEKQKIKAESDAKGVIEFKRGLAAKALKTKRERDLTSSERRVYRLTNVLPDRVIEKFKGV